MSDPSHKTLRSFYCRDYLWDLYETIAQELGCSVDYLINESLRHYARSCNYSQASSAEGGASIVMQTTQNALPTPLAHRAPPPLPTTANAMPAMPMSAVPIGLPAVPTPMAQAPVAAYGVPIYAAQPAIPVMQRRPIYLYFQGQCYRIEGDQFTIGRGQDAQLTIRDSNISRKHCVIIWQNNGYAIQDLGSTNGIEYQGQRIDVKRIEEGDRFMLCNYELRFSFNDR